MRGGRHGSVGNTRVRLYCVSTDHAADLAVVWRAAHRSREVWVENRWLQRDQNREFHPPLLNIFKRGPLFNTLTAYWWMASNFVLYYSLTSLVATYL
jgi:hypothetical protein